MSDSSSQQIDFYHLRDDDLATPLAMLAPKIVQSGHKFLILSHSNQFKAISTALWTHDASSFLAHGFNDDAGHEFAKIWFSSDPEINPIGADYLALTHGLMPADISPFARIFNLFDGRSEETLNMARGYWKMWSGDAMKACRYFAQDEFGKWHQKR